jgi:HEAT repeat protein
MAIAQSRLPDRTEADRAVHALTGTDALAREAAIRQLVALPHGAAVRVVELFGDGQLSTRLACIELLEAWGAPIDGIDPWRQETLTPQRLAALKSWARHVADAGPSTQPTTTPSLDPSIARREIAAMLAAADDREVRIIRERLARWRYTLLSMVREQVRSASTDISRQRLTALRYRLVASDELAATWIDGIERLASSNADERHKALDELGPRAGSEVDLLLELFSDPDPLLREGSLRLLHSAGGTESAAALTRLLNDPEPNVRAAVLKQLAEKPQPSVVEPIAQYVAWEKDHDLVVHAVRVLRAVKDQQAMDCLKALLSHESWQVRAEVVEAIGEITSSRGSIADTASVYAAMVKLLDDPDGFVVSRAMVVLSKARLTTTIEPLLKAAERHPDLAPEIIRTISSDRTVGLSAVPQIKTLTQSENPRVRAAAVNALASLAPHASIDQIVAALTDVDASVRTAAAWACLAAIESLKPQDGYVTRSKWLGLSQTREKVDVSQWYADFRAGERPQWTTAIAAPLEKMLASDTAEERVAAGVAMIPLGLEDKALPVLSAAVQSTPGLIGQTARALCWLPSAQRVEFFERLMVLADSDQTRHTIMSHLVILPDPSAAEPLWNVIKQDTSVEMAETIEQNLSRLYFGDQYYSALNLPKSQKRPAIEAAKEHLAGVELQRTVAMALLMRASLPDAAEAAQPLLDDPASSEWLRLDALQVLLLSKPAREAQDLAIRHLGDPVLCKAAVPYLAGGGNAIRLLRGTIDLNFAGDQSMYISQGQAVVIAAPQGLTAEAVRQAMAGGDAAMQGYGGYLLVLLGDRSGLEPLLNIWRMKSVREDQWTQLVYRAVAFTNDPNLVPVLEEVYRSYDKQNTWQIRTFYWTIRSMTGERALALRKQIRDEIGMERLR